MQKKILIVAFIFCSSLHLYAQQWQRVDSIVGEVIRMFPDTINKHLYLAGTFSYYSNGVLKNDIAKLDHQTQNIIPVLLGNEVLELCPGVYYENDTLYAGCEVNGLGITSSMFSIRTNNVWQNLSPGQVFTNPVIGGSFFRTVYFFERLNGELYAAGSFYMLNNIDTLNGIARWDGAQWQPLITGGGIGIDDIASNHLFVINDMIKFNNEIYLGGWFDRAGNLSVPGLAKWTGSAWDTVTTNNLTAPNTFGIYNNELCMGGYGNNALSKLHNGSWVSLASVTESSLPPFYYGYINAIKQFGSDLIISGTFDTVNGVAAKNIARFDGQNWYPIGGGLSYIGQGGRVLALAVMDNCLYAGGYFALPNSIVPASVAVWCNPVNIDDIEKEVPKVTISPNPTSNQINISIAKGIIKRIEIVNVLGEMIQ